MQSQADGDIRFILKYQDHLTKLITLKPKRAEGFIYQLMNIFCDKGAPYILQSDNVREFSNQVSAEDQLFHLFYAKTRVHNICIKYQKK